jgi:hypothetical protein
LLLFQRFFLQSLNCFRKTPQYIHEFTELQSFPDSWFLSSIANIETVALARIFCAVCTLTGWGVDLLERYRLPVLCCTSDVERRLGNRSKKLTARKKIRWWPRSNSSWCLRQRHSWSFNICVR